MPLSDATAGYRAFRRELLVDLPVSALTSSGYCFQIETAYLAWRHGFRVVEMPVTFRDRTAGSSKMSGRIVVEALAQVTRWGLSARWDPEPAATARIPVQINVARHDAPEPAYSQQLDGSTA
jgi:dolichol-phosphate mannosyltransferase